MTDSDLLASALADAVKNHRQLPEFPPGLSLVEGYALQRQLMELLEESPAGLKAGVTSSALQEFFNVDHALLGCLYQAGRLSSGAQVAMRRKLAIECEIGIVVDPDGMPVSAGPAVELVCSDFARREDMTAANLVASNLAADRYVLGDSQPWRSSYDDVVVQLSHNGRLVNEASVLESLGGPVSAVAWMREEAFRRGMHVAVQRLYMTGTCGAVTPAEPGEWVADYDGLGSVSFTIHD